MNNTPDSALYKLRYLIWRLSLVVLDGYGKKCYSQEGEDLILLRLFSKKSKGFYVDVGAHHPRRFSNTFLFYKKGWRGINIDAMPGSMKLFQKQRPRDINIEAPVSKSDDPLVYFHFKDPALNGFESTLSPKRLQLASNEGVEKTTIYPQTLTCILDTHLPENQHIDFLSIDTEGHELSVLESLDFTKYRPVYILTEILNFPLADIEQHPITRYLKAQGYTHFAKTVHTYIFKTQRENES